MNEIELLKERLKQQSEILDDIPNLIFQIVNYYENRQIQDKYKLRSRELCWLLVRRIYVQYKRFKNRNS